MLDHDGVESVDQRSAPFASNFEPLVGGEAIDLPLDLEQRVDAAHDVERDRRYHRCNLALRLRRAAASTSAITKKGRRAWLQHPAFRIASVRRSGSPPPVPLCSRILFKDHLVGLVAEGHPLGRASRWFTRDPRRLSRLFPRRRFDEGPGQERRRRSTRRTWPHAPDRRAHPEFLLQRRGLVRNRPRRLRTGSIAADPRPQWLPCVRHSTATSADRIQARLAPKV